VTLEEWLQWCKRKHKEKGAKGHQAGSGDKWLANLLETFRTNLAVDKGKPVRSEQLGGLLDEAKGVYASIAALNGDTVMDKDELLTAHGGVSEPGRRDAHTRLCLYLSLFHPVSHHALEPAKLP